MTTKKLAATVFCIRLRPIISPSILSIILVLLYLLDPTPATAAPPRQDTTQLTIENASEETICDVFISLTTIASWGEDWLAESETIAPGEQRTFEVAIANHAIGLADCEMTPLLAGFDVPISGPSQLTLTQSDTCLTANAVGQQYYEQSDLTTSLQFLEKALDCYRDLGDRAGEGEPLNNIGTVYHAQGRYEESLAQFEAALAIAREVGDQAAEQTTLNNLGAVYHAQGRYEDALTQYEAALTITRELGDRTSEGTTLHNIGVAYYAEGRYEDALARYEAALTIAREVGNREGEGATLNGIGTVYNAQGRYQDALTQHEAALAIAREVGDRAGEGPTLHNIGSAYHAQGRYEDALAQYEAALAIVRDIGDRAGEGTALSSIGGVYEDQGRYGDALAQFEAALAIAREVGDRAGEGDRLNSIGLVYYAQGRYEDTLAQFEAALAIAREVGDRAGQGRTLNDIGEVYRDQGRYEDALAQYEVALAIRREVGDHAGEATTLNNIALVYDAQGRYEDALMQYEAALAIHQEAGDRSDEGRTLSNIGLVYFAQRHYEDALARYEAALAIHRAVADRKGEARTLYNVALVYYEQGRQEEALAQYEAALALVESLRTTAGTEQARAQFIAQYDFLFDRAIALYLERGQAAEAFFTGERARARSFLDSLATGHVQLDDRELAQLIERERAAYQTRQAVSDALARAGAQDPVDAALVAALESDLATAQTAYDIVAAEIVARGDRLSSLIPGRGLEYVLDTAETQALLPAGATLISYYLYQDQDNTERAVAFVLTRDRFTAVPLPVGEEQISRELRDFRGFADTTDPHPDALRQLHAWLIEPIAEQLTTPNLIVIPHGVLHYLPFAALTDGQQYLGERYTINTLPSASILPFLGEGRSTGGPPLVLGNPAGDPNLTDLPAAEAEAEAVAALFDETAFIGLAATESLVRDQAGRRSMLHIASHAAFNPVAPLQSGLYLAADDAHDGVLHLDEIYGLDLAATDLVVLSACQTNVGTISPGDDVVALNRAFLFAGAPTVIASLWNVDDEATSILMTRFYGYLAEGREKANALRLAQRDLRAERPEYAHPFYWAAFVLNGIGGETAQPSGTTAAAPEDKPRMDLCASAALPLALALVVARRRAGRRDGSE